MFPVGPSGVSLHDPASLYMPKNGGKLPSDFHFSFKRVNYNEMRIRSNAQIFTRGNSLPSLGCVIQLLNIAYPTLTPDSLLRQTLRFPDIGARLRAYLTVYPGSQNAHYLMDFRTVGFPHSLLCHPLALRYLPRTFHQPKCYNKQANKQGTVALRIHA